MLQTTLRLLSRASKKNAPTGSSMKAPMETAGTGMPSSLSSGVITGVSSVQFMRVCMCVLII